MVLFAAAPEWIVDENKAPPIYRVRILVDETQNNTKQNTVLVQYRYGDTVTTLQATGFWCLSECEMKQNTGKPDPTHEMCEIFLWATQQTAQKS